MALSLLTGECAFAQGNSNNNRNNLDHQKQQPGDQQGRRDSGSRPPNHGQNPGYAQDHEHRGARGAGPNHQFYRGGRLPMEYRSRQYVVSDWRGHHLSAPPRGYHWVQAGSDYVLVAIATGVILQLLLSQ